MRANWAYLLMCAPLAFSAAAGEALSSDFLEYLGTGSQADGQWIDPLSLHDTPEAFASLPPAKEGTERRNDTARRPDAAPAKNSSMPPDHNDGGNKK